MAKRQLTLFDCQQQQNKKKVNAMYNIFDVDLVDCFYLPRSEAWRGPHLLLTCGYQPVTTFQCSKAVPFPFC